MVPGEKPNLPLPSTPPLESDLKKRRIFCNPPEKPA